MSNMQLYTRRDLNRNGRPQPHPKTVAKRWCKRGQIMHASVHTPRPITQAWRATLKNTQRWYTWTLNTHVKLWKACQEWCQNMLGNGCKNERDLRPQKRALLNTYPKHSWRELRHQKKRKKFLCIKIHPKTHWYGSLKCLNMVSYTMTHF